MRFRRRTNCYGITVVLNGTGEAYYGTVRLGGNGDQTTWNDVRVALVTAAEEGKTQKILRARVDLATTDPAIQPTSGELRTTLDGVAVHVPLSRQFHFMNIAGGVTHDASHHPVAAAHQLDVTFRPMPATHCR